MAFLKRGSWEIAHPLIWLFQRSNGIKGTVSKVKHFSSYPRNSPDLDLIESLWSQLKQWQSRECATWMAGLKKIALKSGGRSHYHTFSRSTKACKDAGKRLERSRRARPSIKLVTDMLIVLSCP